MTDFADQGRHAHAGDKREAADQEVHQDVVLRVSKQGKKLQRNHDDQSRARKRIHHKETNEGPGATRRSSIRTDDFRGNGQDLSFRARSDGVGSHQSCVHSLRDKEYHEQQIQEY